MSIPTVDHTFDVPVDEYEGKVVYGEKKRKSGIATFESHTDQLQPAIAELGKLERLAQCTFLKMYK